MFSLLVLLLVSCVPDGECRFSDVVVGTFVVDAASGDRFHPQVTGSVKCGGEPSGTYAAARFYGDSNYSFLLAKETEYVGGVGAFSDEPAKSFAIAAVEVELGFPDRKKLFDDRVPMTCVEFRADSSNIESWKRVGCVLTDD